LSIESKGRGAKEETRRKFDLNKFDFLKEKIFELL